MTRRLFLSALLLLGLLQLLGACQRKHKPLILIGEEQVSLQEFRRELRPLQDDLKQLPASEQKLLLRQTLSQLIDQKLLAAEARQRGIDVGETELDEALAGLRGNYTSDEYQEMLRASGQDPDHWLQQLRLGLLSTKVAREVTRDRIHISDQQVEEAYLQRRDSYQHPEQLQARQILLQSEEEAIRLRNRLLSGESFAALAARYSQSPDRENGGSLGLFARGQFPEEFDKVLFSLPLGRISEPAKSPYGIHLFLVEKRIPAGVLPLEQVAAEIRHELESEEQTRLFQQWLLERREATPLQIDWEQLDKLHFDKAE